MFHFIFAIFAFAIFFIRAKRLSKSGIVWGVTGFLALLVPGLALSGITRVLTESPDMRIFVAIAGLLLGLVVAKIVFDKYLRFEPKEPKLTRED